MSEVKPRKVKAKITRFVTEIAIVYLDSDGNIEEIDEIMDELDYEDAEIQETRTVFSVFN